MVVFRGVAHPPPASGERKDPADLSAAEIRTTNLSGKPLLYEHQSGEKVGNVLASWEGPRGELRVAAKVNDASAAAQVRNGKLRGLSLGTAMLSNTSGDVLYRAQDELSLCTEGRRPGTWITHVDDRPVHSQSNASKSGVSPSLSAITHFALPRK